MGWHHRPRDRVRLNYRDKTLPHQGKPATVLIRPGRGKGPKNYLVQLDDGPRVVVPGGNLKGA